LSQVICRLLVGFRIHQDWKNAMYQGERAAGALQFCNLGYEKVLFMSKLDGEGSNVRI
jgi:hypothetical protein